MGKEIIAEPDLQFTKDLIAAGADDLKKCYQCATCSVACKISPDNEPFPRKEMIWAQWGLKDKLLNDPDVWLCHQCNDCSTQCPRGANPGDVLKAVRKMSIQQNSWPSFMGKLVGQPSMAIVILGIPVLVVLGLLAYSGWRFPEGTVAYPNFIKLVPVQIIYSAALLFAVLSMVMSLRSYWDNLNKNASIDVDEQKMGFVPALIEALKDILPHTTFKDCEANNIRYSTHLMAFWGMVGLFITTSIVAFNFDILHLKPPSQNGPGTIPIKILGNISAIAFILGLTIMLVRRLTVPSQAGNSSYFDWLFLLIIFGTGVTGLSTELIRWSGFPHGAYVSYAIHLMFILALFLYLPFSKFAHIGYRTVAIAWSKSRGRNKQYATEPNVPVTQQEQGDTLKQAS